MAEKDIISAKVKTIDNIAQVKHTNSSEDATNKSKLTEKAQKDSVTIKKMPTDGKNQPFFTKDLIKCVVVLAVIALVAGVILGVINWVTYVDPESAIKSKVGKIYSVSETEVKNITSTFDSSLLAYNGSKSYINAVYTLADAYGNDVLAYYAVGSGAYSGAVEFIICVKDGKIDNISVYSSSETASIGGKVLKYDNINKYVGLSLSTITDYELATSGEAKDSPVYITGATKSTKAVVNAIIAVAYTYNENLGGIA